MTILSDYEYQVADLLHDPTHARWSLTQLDAYINEARKQLVMDTGCLRSLQTSYVTQGVEQYTFGQVGGAAILAGGSGYVSPTVAFSGGGGTGVAAALTQSGGAVNTIVFSSYGSGYSSAPSAVVSGGAGAQIQVGVINVNTFDILAVAVFWGNQRIQLDWRPFRTFSALFRPYVASAYQRLPACWAVYGDSTIFVGPTPDQTYQVELDTIILPNPYAVSDYTTVDPIPVMSQDPIKYYAASLAKRNAQSFGEAESFLNDYNRRLKEVTAAYTGRMPSTRS